MNRVFVLGNGESRKKINLNTIKTFGKIYGCNAIYRDIAPDALICVDGGMIHEVYTSGYCSNNKCYFRGWTKLPDFMYSDMASMDELMGWGEGLRTENAKENKSQFVFHGTDPNQIKRQYEYILKTHNVTDEYDQIELRQLMGNHQQWVTWVDDNDCAEQIPIEIEGWSAGPIAVRIALEQEKPTDVFLIGFDLGSATGLVNNIYKGTSNYVTQDAPETPSSNWINQHMENFKDFPDVKFWKVNPYPLGTDGTSQFVEQWRKFDNVEYLSFDELQLVLDYGIFL